VAVACKASGQCLIADHVQQLHWLVLCSLGSSISDDLFFHDDPSTSLSFVVNIY
jgi:hypothetical protein